MRGVLKVPNPPCRLGRHARHREVRRLVGVAGGVRNARVLVGVVEVAAARAQIAVVAQPDVHVGAHAGLIALEAPGRFRQVGGLRRGQPVGAHRVVGGQPARRAGGRHQDAGVGVHLVRRIRQLAEGLPGRLLLVDLARLGAGRERVFVGAPHDARRDRAEEEQLVPHDRPAQRAAELALVVGLLVVLEVADVGEVVRVEDEALHRGRAETAAAVVVVGLAGEEVAARLGHGADDAAKGAAEFGVHAAGLDLHFLQVLEHRVLARVAVQQAVGGDAVDRERVLGGAGAVHLQAALELTGVDAGSREGQTLEAAPLGQPVELLRRDVVRQRDLGEVELLGGVRRDVHRFGEHAGPQLGVHADGSSQQDDHVVDRHLLERVELEGDRIAAGFEVGETVGAVTAAHHHALGAGLDVGGRHRRSRDGRLGGIGHGAGQSAKSLLRACHPRDQADQRHRNQADASCHRSHSSRHPRRQRPGARSAPGDTASRRAQ